MGVSLSWIAAQSTTADEFYRKLSLSETERAEITTISPWLA